VPSNTTQKDAQRRTWAIKVLATHLHDGIDGSALVSQGEVVVREPGLLEREPDGLAPTGKARPIDELEGAMSAHGFDREEGALRGEAGEGFGLEMGAREGRAGSAAHLGWMGWQALSNRIRARRTGSGLAGEAQRATIRTADGPLALSASLTLSPAHPHAARLSLALWPMEDDSYPPGNFAPEEPVAEDVLEAGEGEAYGVADVGSSSTVRGGKRKREAPPPNATLTSEQVQAKLVRSGPGATGRKIALGLEELTPSAFDSASQHHLNRSLLAQAKKAQTFELQRLRKHRCAQLEEAILVLDRL
jgi:hypothetical protein